MPFRWGRSQNSIFHASHLAKLGRFKGSEKQSHQSASETQTLTVGQHHFGSIWYNNESESQYDFASTIPAQKLTNNRTSMIAVCIWI